MAASRERMGTETGKGAALRPPPPEEPPLSELEFTGCKAVPMSYAELLRYEGRLEVWDARSGTAWMVSEPTSPTHESPSHGLSGLVERIGAVRGSPIKCYGSMDLLVRNERGRPRRIMQADQTVYLYPSRVDLLGSSAMVVGEHPYPDVVLEVDHTTDVRRGKLKLYEAWGFPEVWVEVPERRTPSRPWGTLPGLTIHLLEEGAYSEVSRQPCVSRLAGGGHPRRAERGRAFGVDARAVGASGSDPGGARRDGAGRRPPAPLPARREPGGRRGEG